MSTARALTFFLSMSVILSEMMQIVNVVLDSVGIQFDEQSRGTGPRATVRIGWFAGDRPLRYGEDKFLTCPELFSFRMVLMIGFFFRKT